MKDASLLDVDLAKALGKELNKKIEFQPIDWTMKESELKAGNIDLIWKNNRKMEYNIINVQISGI